MLSCGGELVKATSNQMRETENPALGEVITSVPVANKTDVDRAIQAAKIQCEQNWKHIDPLDRAEVIQ